MKASVHFKNVVQAYLEQRAEQDELFAVAYAKHTKNIDDCITYILNQVKQRGCNGFEDQESMGLRLSGALVILRKYCDFQ